jgi:hypothetical protein
VGVSAPESTQRRKALYLVISPGKHITTTSVLVDGAPGEALPRITVINAAYEPCAYAQRGVPDIARARAFGDAVAVGIKAFSEDTGKPLTAILVRTPPPADVMVRPQFLQENTWMEAFVVGTVFGHFPRSPIWYVHPKDVRENLFPGEIFKSWEDEEAAAMEMAKFVAPTSDIKHKREALCVTVALHHFKRFSPGW